MRLATLGLIVALFLTTAVYASPTQLELQFINSFKGSDYYYFPASVRVENGYITVDVQIRYKVPKQYLTHQIDTIRIDPAERRVQGLLTVVYDASNRERLRDDSKDVWYYVDKYEGNYQLLDVLIAYCRSRGMTINTVAPPYIPDDFYYVTTSAANDVFVFLTPATVRATAGVISFETRVVRANPVGDVKYQEFRQEILVSEKKTRLLEGRSYDSTGKLVKTVPDTDWVIIQPDAVFDGVYQVVLKFCRINNIPLE